MTERFRFIEDFDWKPTPAVTVAFKAGHEGPVVAAAAVSGKITKAVVAAAKKAGKGQTVKSGKTNG